MQCELALCMAKYFSNEVEQNVRMNVGLIGPWSNLPSLERESKYVVLGVLFIGMYRLSCEIPKG